VRTRRLWRHEGCRGAGGHAGGSDMKKNSSTRVQGAAVRLKRIVATTRIVMSARPSLLIMPVATDQRLSLLWLRPVTTNFVKNRNLEHVDLFNILHNVIPNLEEIDSKFRTNGELIEVIIRELIYSILHNTNTTS
jgi:hypothetical protein